MNVIVGQTPITVTDVKIMNNFSEIRGFVLGIMQIRIKTVPFGLRQDIYPMKEEEKNKKIQISMNSPNFY